ncbi:MAG: type II toxin-antitoxin system HicB family antitoxin [Desulfotomaculales bacterium]
MEYTVIIHSAEEGGYWAEVPALPGCYSQGESIEETICNVREAIEAHLEALREEGEEPPAEEPVVGTFRVAVAGG